MSAFRDASLRLQTQALALDDRIFSAMDCAMSLEQQLTKALHTFIRLRANTDRLEEEKSGLLQRQAEMATERADLRDRLSSSMAASATASSSARAVEHELAKIKKDYEAFRQRTQIDANGRKVELEASRLEVKEAEILLLDAQAAAKAAETRIMEMERNHSHTFGELFVQKEDLEEEHRMACQKAHEAELKEAVAWRQVDLERSQRNAAEGRLLDAAIGGVSLQDELNKISLEVRDVLRTHAFNKKSQGGAEREQLINKLNSMFQEQMVEAVSVITQAHSDIFAFREHAECSQTETEIISGQKMVLEQQLAAAQLELANASSSLESQSARIQELLEEQVDMQKQLEEKTQKHNRLQKLAAETATRTNQEVAELLRERQELGKGFDEAIERTNDAEKELEGVRDQISEMKHRMSQLEKERVEHREAISKFEEALAQAREDLMIKDEALSLAADESLLLKQDRQLDQLRRAGDVPFQETVLKGLILDLKSTESSVKEVFASLHMAESHYGHCCEVRSQTLTELQKQKTRTKTELDSALERAEKAERVAGDLKSQLRREIVELEKHTEVANARAELAQGKVEEIKKEVVRERIMRAESEEKISKLGAVKQRLDLNKSPPEGEKPLAGVQEEESPPPNRKDPSELRARDVFLLMAELDASETKVLEQQRRVKEMQERETDAQIEISRLSQDLDKLRNDLRGKQRELNLLNISLGETQEKLRVSQEECTNVAEQEKRERASNAAVLEAYTHELVGLLNELQGVEDNVKEVSSVTRRWEVHHQKCCAKRIDAAVELVGSKELVVRSRAEADQERERAARELDQTKLEVERAHREKLEVHRQVLDLSNSTTGLEHDLMQMAEAAEIGSKETAMLLAEIGLKVEAETRRAETAELQVEASRRDADRERAAREIIQTKLSHTSFLVKALDLDVSETMAATKEYHALVLAEERQEKRSMQDALEAAGRRAVMAEGKAEEGRRSIQQERLARADVETRLFRMSELVRQLHTDLQEAMAIQEEVVPQILTKSHASTDIFLLMAELDKSETKVSEHENRVRALTDREAGARREIVRLQELMVMKQEKYAVELSDVHQQLAETADDNKDLVARLFQSKQETFKAARWHQEESLAVSAGLDQADSELVFLEELLFRVKEKAGSKTEAIDFARQAETAYLRIELAESEAKRSDVQGKLMDSASRMAKLKADLAGKQHERTEERAEWDRVRGLLAAHVERLAKEVEGAREDVHRSSMVILQLESRALRDNGPLAVAMGRVSRGEGVGGTGLREVGAQMEMLKMGLKSVEERCVRQEAEMKDFSAKERTLRGEKLQLEEALKEKAVEGEKAVLDLLTALKDLDDSRARAKKMSAQVGNATNTSRGMHEVLSKGVAGLSATLAKVEARLGDSQLEVRKLVKKGRMLEGMGQVLRSALAQSEARGGELQALLTEGTSRISVLQDDLTAERKRHDAERLQLDSEFGHCAQRLREAQVQSEKMEDERRGLRLEIAVLNSELNAEKQKASARAKDVYRAFGKTALHDGDNDATKSTVVAIRGGAMERGREVTWSPVRGAGDVGWDPEERQVEKSRFEKEALLDRDWMDDAGEKSIGGMLDATGPEISLSRRLPAAQRGDKKRGTPGERALMLRGGPCAGGEEDCNVRVRLAEEKALKANIRCKDLEGSCERLQEQCRVLSESLKARPVGKPGDLAASENMQKEKLALDLLAALKNLDQARAAKEVASMQVAETGRDNQRLVDEGKKNEKIYEKEIRSLHAALSHSQEVQSRASGQAAELLTELKTLQHSMREAESRFDVSSPGPRFIPWSSPSQSRLGVSDLRLSPEGSTGKERKLERDKEQLALKVEGMRSALQMKEQRSSVLQKCLEMASTRESDLFQELHALHLEMRNDWQAISAASARRAGGAELHILSMIGENKIMASCEPNNQDLPKKAADMRGVYKKVVVEMKRAHSKLISELETALGSAELNENDADHAQCALKELRLQVTSLKSHMHAMQAELHSTRQMRAALQERLEASGVRERIIQEELSAANAGFRSERGKMLAKAEEAEGLKERIITLVRKVEQSRQETSSVRNQTIKHDRSLLDERSDRDFQLAVRDERVQQLVLERDAVLNRKAREEAGWEKRIAELEGQRAQQEPELEEAKAKRQEAEAALEALRASVKEERRGKENAQKRCKEEEERRTDAEARAKRAEGSMREVEHEVEELKAKVREKEEVQRRLMRLETRKEELESEVERLNSRIREQDSMQAVLKEEAGRERNVAAGGMKEVDRLQGLLEKAKAKHKQLEGQLQVAVGLAYELRGSTRALTEELLAVEIEVMADGRERAVAEGKVRAAMAREDGLQSQVQSLRAALQHQSLSPVPAPRAATVQPNSRSSDALGRAYGDARAAKAAGDAVGEEHALRVAERKVSGLEAQVMELRQRELRWEETAGRYKRELSAVRKELDSALDAIERVKREKDGIERGRSVREAKLEGELGLAEQRLREERLKAEEREVAIDALESRLHSSRTAVSSFTSSGLREHNHHDPRDRDNIRYGIGRAGERDRSLTHSQLGDSWGQGYPNSQLEDSWGKGYPSHSRY